MKHLARNILYLFLAFGAIIYTALSILMMPIFITIAFVAWVRVNEPGSPEDTDTPETEEEKQR